MQHFLIQKEPGIENKLQWQAIGGVVHAYVDQKLLKSNKIKNFNWCLKHRI